MVLVCAGCGTVKGTPPGDGGDNDAGPNTFEIRLDTKLTPPAEGGVTIEPMGESCGPSCFRYPAGTSVTVTGTPTGPNDFQAWLGGCAGFLTTCTFDVTQDATVTGWFRPRFNYMFVSSQKFPVSTLGSGGTLQAADDACDTLAQAANLTGATGTYRAWLALASAPASSRFVNKRTWIRVDGKLFGDRPTDFGGLGDNTFTPPSKVFFPPRLDENGVDLGNDADTKVAVGQLSSGEPNSNCSDWSSTAGIAFAGDLTDGVARWAGDFNSVACNSSARLYCFETVHNVSATLPTVGGRVAFITNGLYTPGNLAAADTLCRNEATAAGLANPNTFKALLSTTTQSAFDRLGAVGAGPWFRPDGVEIVASPADLGPGTLTAPIDVTAAKGYVGGVAAWTGGASSPNTTAASAQDACSNWTATTGTGVAGSAGTSKPTFFNTSNIFNCSSGSRLYCFEP